jgi:hypothetical protein
MSKPTQNQQKQNQMKNQLIRSLLMVALAAVPGAIQAQPDAHYVPGIEGIKCATLPPPGFYFRDYNVLYTADQLNNGAGNALPGTFQTLVYANVPRAIWITGTKILGGNVGADVVLPLVYTTVSVGPVYHASTFGIGDAYAESTLSWHPGQFDIGAAVGLWIPTGASGTPTSPGLGFWTPELTFGVTYYLDKEKTWAISALNRYEFNSADRDDHASDATPGQAWTLEYGISKSVTKKIDLGVVGYYQQRITSSTGDQPMAAMLFPYSRVAAVGPEVNVDFPFVIASLRYNYEFMADNRAQGHTVALTLTKKF